MGIRQKKGRRDVRGCIGAVGIGWCARHEEVAAPMRVRVAMGWRAQRAPLGKRMARADGERQRGCVRGSRAVCSRARGRTRQYSSQQALPIWTPHWPRWIEITSRMDSVGGWIWRLLECLQRFITAEASKKKLRKPLRETSDQFPRILPEISPIPR